MSAKIVMVVKYAVNMFLNQRTLIKKTLTKILFCSSGPPLTLKVTSTWYVVLSSPWNQKLKETIDVYSKLLSDLKLRFTMVVIQYNVC